MSTARSSDDLTATDVAGAILIINESSIAADELKVILQATNPSIVIADSPINARATLDEREFAVIICALSGMSGAHIEAAKTIREHHHNRTTPIILITPAGIHQAMAMRAVGAGVVDCIEDPVDDFVLRAKVKMYADAYRNRRRLREVESSNKASESLNNVLTGLPGHALFIDRAEQAMRQASRNGGRVAIAAIDLDQINDVKETLGPVSGDELLRQIAARLTTTLRRSDTVGHVSARAFGCVLACDTRDGVETVTTRLERVMSEPFLIGGHRITLGGGIGVALYPEHGHESQVLLDCATAVMTIAKQNSLGHLFYDPIHHAESDDSAETKAEMNAEELFKVNAA